MRSRHIALPLLLLAAGCGSSTDGVASEAPLESAAIDETVTVRDPACTVRAADGTTTTRPMSFPVHLQADRATGAVAATVTSAIEPLGVTSLFDGGWNSFDGSKESASGRWLDVRGGMTGTTLAMSWSERAPGADAVLCANLAGQATFRMAPALQTPPAPICAFMVVNGVPSTGIHAKVRIDAYHGTFGTFGKDLHEYAHATIVAMPWIHDAALLDSLDVELALRVAPDTGLPHEIPLAVGQLIELAGEYVPKHLAAPTPNGEQSAVLHYTHAECGYVKIDGVRYH